MSEPYDVSTQADIAAGRRRLVDRTGREWIEADERAYESAREKIAAELDAPSDPTKPWLIVLASRLALLGCPDAAHSTRRAWEAWQALRRQRDATRDAITDRDDAGLMLTGILEKTKEELKQAERERDRLRAELDVAIGLYAHVQRIPIGDAADTVRNSVNINELEGSDA